MLTWFRSALKKAVRDTAGNVAIMFSITAPMLVGGVTLGVEAGYWYYRQATLQSAADAAAYAAAIEARAGSASSVMTSAATAAATDNGYAAATGTLTMTGPYSAGSGKTAVKVVLKRPEQRFFSRVFTTAPIYTSASAIASYNTSANACILALDKSASKAVLFSGSANLKLTGCDVMANSIATDAMVAQGSSTVSAPCLLSGGGMQLNSNVTVTGCTAALTNQPQVADPYASTPFPSPPTACNNTYNSKSGKAPLPNVCYNGLTLDSTTLASGNYYVSGSGLKINSNAVVSGSSITIFLIGTASVSINGTATVKLTAPTTGPYAGILFYSDPTATSVVSSTFNGTPTSSLTGALYFPKQSVNYLGNFSGLNGCTQVVGLTVQWSGNATVNVDCSSYGMKAVNIPSIVRLTG